MQQGTKQWLDLRKRHIGGSDAPILMGNCKYKINDGRYKTPNILWQEKLGLLNIDSDNDSTRFGKRMEEPAREAYEKMTGIQMKPEVIFHKEVSYMMSSLDGLSKNKDIAVEIKNCNAEDHAAAMLGKVPNHYYAQVQHQLACLGHDRMHYFSFHKGHGVIVEVKKDLDYLEVLYDRESEFWDCVENLKEPSLIDLDFKEMGKEWEEKAQRIWDIEEEIRENEKIIKDIKEELKSLSGGVNCRSGLFRLISTSRKGSIDYSCIPEISLLDLEKYRKQNTVSWSLKRGKK